MIGIDYGYGTQPLTGNRGSAAWPHFRQRHGHAVVDVAGSRIGFGRSANGRSCDRQGPRSYHEASTRRGMGLTMLLNRGLQGQDRTRTNFTKLNKKRATLYLRGVGLVIGTPQ